MTVGQFASLSPGTGPTSIGSLSKDAGGIPVQLPGSFSDIVDITVGPYDFLLFALTHKKSQYHVKPRPDPTRPEDETK